MEGDTASTSFVLSPAPHWLRYFAIPLLFRLPLPAFAVRRLLIGPDAFPEFVTAIKHAIRKVRPQILAARVRSVLELDCSESLQCCSAPLLYLSANNDTLVCLSSLQAIAAIRPDAEIKTLPGPHLLLQANPLAAWNEIQLFLKAHQCQPGDEYATS